MSVKAKASVVATVVALAAVWLVFQDVTEQSDKPSHVIVTGSWLPSPREEMVEVTMTVGSETKITRHIVAPFGPKVYKVPRGTRVTIRMRMLGSYGGNFLGCIIKVNGVEEMSTPDHKGVGPGTEAFCWAVA